MKDLNPGIMKGLNPGIIETSMRVAKRARASHIHRYTKRDKV
jgi:hypothetical protein